MAAANKSKRNSKRNKGKVLDISTQETDSDTRKENIETGEHSQMNFPCTNCNNLFKNKPSFSNHLKKCLVAQIQLNRSSDQIFKTETPTTRVPTKQMQQSSAITANKPRVICHKCQSTFENHGRLLNHKKTLSSR